MEPDTFQWCPGTGPEGMGTNQNTAVPSEHLETTVRMTEHWRRCPRAAVESPSLKKFKSYLDTVLSSLL